MHPQDTTPAPLCECGCGETTNHQTYLKGQPFARYVKGHHLRKSAERILIDDKTGCHVWQGALRGKGYGHMWVTGHIVATHIYYYEKKYGPVPKGLELDHTCRNPTCCNPDHLEPVTNIENVRRGKSTRLTLSSAQTIKISNESAKILAERYGVCVNTIYAIRSGKRWRNA